MANRRFEMHHYRQTLMRMRQGDTDRRIAADKLMGRARAAAVRALATERGWLDPAAALPDEATLSEVFEAGKRDRKRAARSSTLEPHRALIAGWVGGGAPRMSCVFRGIVTARFG